MTRVQWQALTVPGDAVVDVVADDDTTTPVLSFHSPSDIAGGIQTVYSRTTTLTNDEIKALPTAFGDGSVEIVPAPGAGKFIRLVRLQFVAHIVGVYTNVHADGVLNVAYTDEADIGYVPNDSGASWTYLTKLLTDGNIVEPLLANDATTANWGTMPLVLEEPGVDNVGISINVDNGGAGLFTGGNAANTIKVTVLYMVIDL